jgi:hypothetical protein
LTTSLDAKLDSNQIFLYFHISINLFKNQDVIKKSESKNFIQKLIKTIKAKTEVREEYLKMVKFLFRTIMIISQIAIFENLNELIPFIEEALSDENHIYEVSDILLLMLKVPVLFQALIQKGISEKYLSFDVPESLM